MLLCIFHPLKICRPKLNKLLKKTFQLSYIFRGFNKHSGKFVKNINSFSDTLYYYILESYLGGLSIFYGMLTLPICYAMFRSLFSAKLKTEVKVFLNKMLRGYIKIWLFEILEKFIFSTWFSR